MDKKISGLDPAGALDGTEEVELVKAGGNVRSTTQAIALLVEGQSPAAINVSYDPAVSGLDATNVQDALDAISAFNPASAASIISSWPKLNRAYERGFYTAEVVDNFGGFSDGGSLSGSVDSSVGSSTGLLHRTSSRKQAFFTNLASPGTQTMNPKELNNGLGQFRHMSGTPAVPGGLFLYHRFGVSFNTTQTLTGRYFNGFCPNVNFTALFAGSDGAFDAMANVMGVGKYDTDTNWQLIVNDAAGAITKVDTGISFLSTINQILELYIYSDYATDSVTVIFRVVDTNTVFSTVFTTNLPAADQNLFWTFIGNNGYHQDFEDKAVFLHWMQLTMNPGF